MRYTFLSPPHHPLPIPPTAIHGHPLIKPLPCLQALQSESGLNIELKEDLAALSMELRRLQLAEEEHHDSGGAGHTLESPTTSPQANGTLPDTSDAVSSACEELREAEQVGQACHIYP